MSFHGAAFAAAEIARRCGVAHTVRAVEVRASRIHCSLAVQTVSPKCGRVGLTLNRQTGLCPLCTERYHLEQERAFNEQIERERAEVEASGELEPARRERDSLRQRNSRLCRKYGLKSRRERKNDALMSMLRLTFPTTEEASDGLSLRAEVSERRARALR